MEETREEQGKKYAKLVAKAWSDESFKEKLMSDSRAVLEAEGISVPPGVDVKVMEQTDTQFFMVIPQKPPIEQYDVLPDRIQASSFTTGYSGMCSCCI